jgi:hypothetical protein
VAANGLAFLQFVQRRVNVAFREVKYATAHFAEARDDPVPVQWFPRDDRQEQEFQLPDVPQLTHTYLLEVCQGDVNTDKPGPLSLD